MQQLKDSTNTLEPRERNACSSNRRPTSVDRGTQKLSGVDRSAQTRQVHTKSPPIHLHHHRIQLAVYKPTINLTPLPPYEEPLNKANRPTVYVQRLWSILSIVYKSLMKQEPIYVQDLFVIKEYSRSKRYFPLVQPQFKTQRYGFNSFA